MRRPARRYRRLAAAIAQIHARQVRVLAWRVTFIERNPLDPRGSCTYVGRWHNPDITPALYFARFRTTAVAEFLHHLYEPGVHQVQAVQAKIVLPTALDLTGHLPADLARYVERALVDSEWGRDRGGVLGGVAYDLGYSGIVAPSLRGRGVNIALFMGRRARGVRTRIRKRVTFTVEVG